MSKIDIAYIPIVGRGLQINIICALHGIQAKFIKSISNQSQTILKIKAELHKTIKPSKNLKFVLISGLYSESHTDSIQVIKI